MNVSFRRAGGVKRHAGLVAVGVFEGERALEGPTAALDRAARGAISTLLRSRDFTGRYLDTTLLYPSGGRFRRILLVGLGARAAWTPHRMRQVAATAARQARAIRAGTLATTTPVARGLRFDLERAAQASAEGTVLGQYRLDGYQRDPGPPPLRRVDIVAATEDGNARRLRDAVARGSRWAEAACLARDLAGTPGQDLTPALLAKRAREIARACGARAKVLGVRDLKRLGMGAVLAVGRGSAHPPCFIVLERDPGAAPRRTTRERARGERGTVVVIGKGVTFDTGGISLKPRENMAKMKYDMSGAAAVLGMFRALPTVAHPFRVVGLIPAAENMPGGRALKPGDVVRALDGTTIEVTNTDAEGRLILADALGYAHRYQPAAVVDLATLTGAISIALGHLAAGLFSVDDELCEELLAAGEASGERLWRMPLWEEHVQEMRSETADLVNSSGTREGGAILAAAFLRHFAGRMRWAHLDIASTAWSPVDRPHEPRGPTGFGVRLLLEWLSRRSATSL